MAHAYHSTGENTIDSPNHRRRKRSKLGLRSSVFSWMHRFKANLRKVASEALPDFGNCSDGGSTVEALFDGETEVAVDRNAADTEVEARSSTSATLTAKSEEPLGPSTDGITHPLTFDTFDPEEQRRRIHSQRPGPFIDGPELWRLRRALWTAKTQENTLKEASEHIANFQKIGAHYYPRIYRKLVVDDKPLTQPVNLQDVMKIIDAGWVETSKWDRASKGLA